MVSFVSRPLYLSRPLTGTFSEIDADLIRSSFDWGRIGSTNSSLISFTRLGFVRNTISQDEPSEIEVRLSIPKISCDLACSR